MLYPREVSGYTFYVCLAFEEFVEIEATFEDMFEEVL